MSKNAEKKRKLITKTKINSPISEQFKLVRTGIEFAGVDSPFKTILVTSPEAMSGKSTVSANLAVVYAKKGKKTLLIDGDMRKPTIHQTFNKSIFFGLSTSLTEDFKLSEICQKTEVDGLFVLTSGPIPPNPNELLGSKRMALLLNELKKDFDIVIIDTPPVTVVSDALVLAPQIDGIILVVRSRKTKKEKAKQAIEQIKITRTPIIGTVLNRDLEKLDNNYYYAYK
ncbi:CpsD/CapB family tyrosine-protein kinase [Carnobacterium divergens]|uniref:Tyrosine-protein kinase CpsD n=1 Tax=Carnobacterium divergens TaxID=2748 RepID=A0AAW8R7Z2_CARDV|nr:CpsD/CapB family tyrosine-protein kinase [Carnobacterium divergens]MDT1957207.1 CpsD/CapB family tyrosine-protein kinase [Carnobacterium divergens]MDT1973177.1 CpsD/CapB family tyrosine-protein kinase [Carnobacterium divergens]